MPMMTSTDTAASDSNPEPAQDQDGAPIGKLARLIGQAARFEGDLCGLGAGDHAALARID